MFAVSLDMQQRLVDDGVPLPSPDRQGLPTSGWRAFYQRRHRELQPITEQALAALYADVQGRLERYRPGPDARERPAPVDSRLIPGCAVRPRAA